MVISKTVWTPIAIGYTNVVPAQPVIHVAYSKIANAINVLIVTKYGQCQAHVFADLIVRSLINKK